MAEKEGLIGLMKNEKNIIGKSVKDGLGKGRWVRKA